jgi:hypothetical protein
VVSHFRETMGGVDFGARSRSETIEIRKNGGITDGTGKFARIQDSIIAAARCLILH